MFTYLIDWMSLIELAALILCFLFCFTNLVENVSKIRNGRIDHDSIASVSCSLSFEENFDDTAGLYNIYSI